MLKVSMRRDAGRKSRLAKDASSLALIAAGLFAPALAQAQAELQHVAPNTSQQATPANEQSTPATTPTDNASDNGSSTGTSSSDVVVTGRRAALQAADERKRRSETVIDSVVADDASKLPDNSITEVLQRVSGVTIVRFAALNDPDHYSVEGSGIQVRGLTGVASRLNGRDIFSANNGRAIQFADVTPELLAAVDVYKASTADLIEGGTGGQIDLRTKVPFDFKHGLHVAATGDLSVGDLARKADGSGSILVADTFDTPVGRIGFLGDYAYSRLSSNSHFFRVEPYYRQRIGAADYYIPGGYDYGEEDFQRTRTGIYGAVQWAPTNSLTITGTFFQSRYKNRSGDWGQFVSLTPGGNAFTVDPANSKFDSNNLLVSTPGFFIRDNTSFLPGGTLSADGNKGAYRSTTTTRDYSLSFTWRPDNSPLSVSGSLQRVSSSQTYGRLDVFRDVAFPNSFGLDLSGDLPRVTQPAGSQAAFSNPANYFWAASMPHDEDNNGRLDAAQLDAEYKFDNSFFRSIKVGGRIARRTERDLQDGYNWVALGRGWNGDPQLTFANAAPGDVENHAFKDFFHGQASLPGNLLFPTDALARQYIGNRTGLTQAPPAGFCPPGTEFNCSASGPLPRTGYGGEGSVPALVPNTNETKTYAGYALVRFGAADGIGITGNVGARVVRIENNATGSILQNATTFVRNGQTLSLTSATTPRDGRANFTYVLPSINLDYSPTDKIKLRAAYNITLDLPSFNALRAAGSVGVATTAAVAASPAGAPGVFTNFTTDAGNPQLTPTTSNNFDLSFEWYPRQGTSFHVAPFYKILKNLPIYSITTTPVTVQFTNGTTETANAATTDFANSTRKATVRGVEVGGRFFFDMLPGFFSGFGFEGNYTFIDSANPGDLYRDINGVVHNDVPLVGLSKHNFNATLLYERKILSARVAYSWRSRYLQSTNSNGTNPTYSYYSAPGVVTNNSGIAGTAGAGTQIALPIYGDTYGQVEASVRFKVTDNFSFYVQGTNLTNSTQRTLQGGYPGGELVGRSWFQTDRRLLTGISLAF